MMHRSNLLTAGRQRVLAFCARNEFSPPEFKVYERTDWSVQACAYWRRNVVHICPDLCARPGLAGRSWSWPGYVIDRTPYGVCAHELGHHVDHMMSEVKGSYNGDFSVTLRKATAEPALTGYVPDDGEWFAEIFRLFVTNPELCWRLRPRTYNALAGCYNPLEPERLADDVLIGLDAPERTLAAARNHIKRAAREQARARIESERLL